MLPKDLMNLIDKYNEIGIMCHNADNVYWFNGKRFEFWCEKLHNFEYDMLYIDNQIYGIDMSNYTIYQFKNKCFVKTIIYGLVKEYFTKFYSSRFIYLEDHSIVNSSNNALVNVKYDESGKKITTVLTSNINIESYCRLLKHNNLIYCFTAKKLGVFNLIDKSWIFIHHNYMMDNIYTMNCVNDLIYFFDGTHCDFIFDTKLNQWQNIESIVFPERKKDGKRKSNQVIY